MQNSNLTLKYEIVKLKEKINKMESSQNEVDKQKSVDSGKSPLKLSLDKEDL